MVFRPAIDDRVCFVLRPYAATFHDSFKQIIRPAIEEVGLICLGGDEDWADQAIIQTVWNNIWRARVVVADVTSRNPNVNYELGMCHALGVPTVIIAQTLEDIPFDYRHRHCVIYSANDVAAAKAKVAGSLKMIIQGKQSLDPLLSWPCDVVPNAPRFRNDNVDAFPELLQHIRQKDLKEAFLIQMTGNNVKEIICGLWKTNANVEIFISAGEDCFGVNKWQQSRIGRFLSDIGNELRNIPNRGTSGAIEVFQYHAPASIRAMLFDDQLLTFGAYAYEKHYINDEHGTVLDVRGHELPHVLLAYSDPDFNTVRESLLRTIRNWKENDIVGSAMKFDRSTFGYRSART